MPGSPASPFADAIRGKGEENSAAWPSGNKTILRVARQVSAQPKRFLAYRSCQVPAVPIRHQPHGGSHRLDRIAQRRAIARRGFSVVGSRPAGRRCRCGRRRPSNGRHGAKVGAAAATAGDGGVRTERSVLPVSARGDTVLDAAQPELSLPLVVQDTPPERLTKV